MNLTEKLTLLMQEQGINKRQLSQLSNIPYTTIDGLYKKGYSNAKLSTLQQIANFFNVSLDYICDDNITDINFGKDSTLFANSSLSTNEQELLSDYRNLTPNGQEKTTEYVKDLLSNPKYIRVSTTDFKTLRQNAEALKAAFDAKNQRVPTKK